MFMDRREVSMATSAGAKATRTKSGRQGKKVFISYRRQDSDESAGRIRDWLTQSERLRPDDVFMDVHDVAPGNDFVAAVADAIRKCHSMLVVIGPNWLTGYQTLSPYVEEEVAQALGGRVQVIPVLVRGASMPSPDAVPPRIQRLAYLNASKVRPDEDFDHDMSRLASAIGVKATRSSGRRFGRAWLAAVAILLLLAGVVGVLSQVPEGNPIWQLVHERVLAQASFLDYQADGWDDDGASCVPKADGYHLMGSAACASPIYGVEDRSTYTVAVTAREVGPHATNIYGIRLRASDAGGYEFYVSSSGYVAMELSVKNQPRSHMLGGVPLNSHVNTGLGAANRIEVRVDGSRLAFLINGYSVAQLDDGTFRRGSLQFISLPTERILNRQPIQEQQLNVGDIAFTDLRITAPLFGG
jgi:hypothetical protein